jgi:hypothetical protein
MRQTFIKTKIPSPVHLSMRSSEAKCHLKEGADQRLGDLTLVGGLLGFHSALLAHGGENNNVGVLLLLLEELGDLLANLVVGKRDIVLGVTVIGHEREETVVGDVEQLVLATRDVGDVHVVSRGRKILVLLASEDVGSNEMDLGVTVLSGLGGGHVDDLARAVLDHDETVLTQSRALHRVGKRGTGIGRIEGHLMLSIVRGGHFDGIDKKSSSLRRKE